MATGGKDRQVREQRERARAYQARQEMHRRVERRRTRDNVLAVVIGAVVILGAAGLQAAYFLAGPGAPTPIPSETATPAPDTSDAPAPDASPSADPLLPDPVPSASTAP